MGYTFKGRVSRPIRKRAPLEGGGVGFTTVPNGREDADATVEVDVDAILRNIGPQALGNRSGVSKFMHGAVVVRVSNRKHTP